MPSVNERPPTPSTSVPDISHHPMVRWEHGWYFSPKLLFPEVDNCASGEDERPSNHGGGFRYRMEEKVIRYLKTKEHHAYIQACDCSEIHRGKVEAHPVNREQDRPQEEQPYARQLRIGVQGKAYDRIP